MKELLNLKKNLKELRKQSHFTQTYVAEQIGISCSSYQAYEWGVTVPTLQNFIKLSKLYGIPCDDLLR